MHRVISVFLLVGTFSVAYAQRPAVSVCPKDMKWMLKYAAPNGKSDDGNERLLRLPCFRTAMRSAFPANHSILGNTVSVAEAADIYTQVYAQGPVSQANRYITIEGCVPHSCPNTGMIWIDTLDKGAIVFAASEEIVTYPITPKSFSGKFHLWIYSTLAPLDVNEPKKLPSQLIGSLNTVFANEAIASVTLIQSDGRLQSVTPETFQLHAPQQQAAR